jgi:hypothetical protein
VAEDHLGTECQQSFRLYEVDRRLGDFKQLSSSPHEGWVADWFCSGQEQQLARGCRQTCKPAKEAVFDLIG